MTLKIKTLLLLTLALSGCSTYHFGKGGRALPGGYDRVAIPMFVNKTQEVGIEPYFTEALRTEFERSNAATVTNKIDAQLILEGTIMTVTYSPSIQINSTSTGLITPPGHQISVPVPTTVNGVTTNVYTPQTNPLPANDVLSTQYQVVVTLKLIARKNSDNTVLWSSDFSTQRQYLGPLLGTPTLADGTPGINTASPLYINRPETIRSTD
jgi:hypothetical protein